MVFDLEETKGHKFDDYSEISFDSTETPYVIGTAAVAANSQCLGIEPGKQTYYKNFIAEEIMFLATKNCLVRFNGATNVQHKIYANVYFAYKRRVHKIYVTRVAEDGKLELWAEGDLPV